MRAAIAVAGTGLAVAGGLLLATSDFLIDATAYGLQTAFMVVATVAAALVWLHRRPGNGVGVLLLALALATAVISLQGADDPYLHSLGVLIEPVFFLLGYLVVFAFPEGRLTGLPERLILAGMTLYFMVAFVPWMFFSPVVPGGAPLAGCDPCPANGLMIADRPEHRREPRHQPHVDGDRAAHGDARPAWPTGWPRRAVRAGGPCCRSTSRHWSSRSRCSRSTASRPA